MYLLDRIFCLLPFHAPYFYPFERVVLNEFQSLAPHELKKLMSEQIRKFNVTQRGGDWDMLLMGKFRFNSSAMPKKIRLPVASGDVKLARLKFNVAGETINAVLHSQDGVLFTINFSASYKRFRGVNQIAVERGVWVAKIDAVEGVDNGV